MLKLLDAATATGNGNAARVGVGGRYCFAVAGTFGGCTVGLQMLGPDGTTWINVEDSSGALAFTTAKAANVDIPAGSYRATITGGAAMTMYANLTKTLN